MEAILRRTHAVALAIDDAFAMLDARVAVAGARNGFYAARVIDRLRWTAFGALAGIVLERARTVELASPFDGPAKDPSTAASIRAAGLIAIAIALMLGRGEVKGASLLVGATIGFAAQALLPLVAVDAGAALAVGAVALILVARYPWSELEPEGAPNGRWPVCAALGAGIAIALENVARPLALLGGSIDDERVFASALIACAAVGAIAFGPLLARAASGAVLALAATATAASAMVALELVAGISNQDGLDFFLRNALGGMVELHLGRQSMLDALACIGLRVFILPGFLLGTTIFLVRDRRALAAMLAGAGLALVLDRLNGWSDAPEPFVDAALRSTRHVEAGVAIAALGAIAWVASSKARALAASAAIVAVAGGAIVALEPIALPISPWDRFTPRPTLFIASSVGLVTCEPTSGGGEVVTLDRKRLTPLPSEEEADRRRFAAALRGARDAEILLVGQLTPARAFTLKALGATRIDRTGAWHAAMPALEAHLFRGGALPPGEVLAPAELRRTYAYVLVPPVDGVAFDPPQRGDDDAPRAFAWIPAATFCADRVASADDGWLPTATLASHGLDAMCVEFDSTLADPARERFELGEPIDRPPTWWWLTKRLDERAQLAATLLFERLRRANANGPHAPITEALALHYAAQAYSSPWDTPAESVELDVRALELLRDRALEAEPGPVLRNTIEGFAAVLVGKREIELLHRCIAPVAARWPVWPALERALAQADLEALDAKGAADRWLAVLALEPHALELYAPCARALIAAGEPERAVVLLGRALELQRERADWVRLHAIARIRSGDASALAAIERLLAADPDDAELAAHLGAQPWPPFPASAPNEHDHEHDLR